MKRLAVGLLAVVASFAMASAVFACPFCDSVAMTFTEEVKAADVAVLAKMVKPPLSTAEADKLDPVAAAQAAQAKFEVVEVVRGADKLGDKKEFTALYFGDAPVGSEFLVMGVNLDDFKDMQWSSPILMTERSKAYLTKILALPEQHVDRLLFVIDYLEDNEEVLRRDAYDEFARTPYDIVKQLRGQIDHERLLGWIQDPETPLSRRRLYFTLLGVNGSEKDVPLLEEMILSPEDKSKIGLDSLIACYLLLAGGDKLPLIEERFIKNEDAEYTHTYAALMALRFHGQESDVIPREKLVKSMRLMLNRPQLADLVIPDLARWEDWEAMPQLVELFKNADKKSSWVRVPVVNYLRSCPLPEAAEHLEELAQIDPDAVKRASTFFPFSAGGEPAATVAPKKPASKKEKAAAEKEQADDAAPAGKPISTDEDQAARAAIKADEAADPAPRLRAAATGDEGTATAPAAVLPPDEVTVSRGWLYATPAAAGLLLFGLYWAILRRPAPRRRFEEKAPAA